MKISTVQRKFEMLAVLITGSGKFLFMDQLHWKLPYILTAILFWLGYIFYQNRNQKGILAYWGFTRNHFWISFKPLLIAGSLSTLAFIAYAIWKNQFNPNWHLLVIIILYPIWGTIQQFLMMPLIGGNLKDGQFIKTNNAVILITALAFSAVHLPNLPLTAATFCLALVYAYLFLKHRNLWPLGLFHGVLGALFYFFVLNRDPWIEVFGA